MKRIIPILLLRNGRCVKGRQFAEYRDTGSPVTAAKIYDAQRVDELVFLDILASEQERPLLLDVVKSTADECFMPLGVGGGIRTCKDIENVLRAGADKVIINTQAVRRPEFVKEAIRIFGSANIVASVDYRTTEGRTQVFIEGGKTATGLDARQWCLELQEMGVGEIILTSIEREGSMEGYDFTFIKNLSEELSIPLVPSGGAGTLEHIHEILTKTEVTGAAIASLFHFTDQNPIKVRYFLNVHGANVRK